MQRFFGSAKFTLRGTTREVRVCLDLEENAIEVWYQTPDLRQPSDQSVLKEQAALSDIHLHLPTGEIESARLEDLFIVSYGPGTWAAVDSTLARALILREESFGMTKIVVQPKSSRVEFVLKPHSPMELEYELFYQNSRISWLTPCTLKFDGGQCLIRGDARGIVITGDQCLLGQEERIRFCLGVIQGAPVHLRSILDGRKLIINLASDNVKGMGRLPENLTDIEPLLQGLFDFFAKMTTTEWTRWRPATYFYLQGLSAPGAETQLISWCTFLEVVDGTDTITKEAIARLLGITLDEADLIRRVRHGLVHHGKEMGPALIEAAREISTHKAQLDNSVFSLDTSNPQRTGVLFFLRFAMLLNRLWVRKAKFSGPWNDYSDYSS